jgi:hypothetical protein
MSDNEKIGKAYIQTIAILNDRIRELEKQLNQKILFGKDEVMACYKWSEYTLMKWVNKGLPVLIVDGKYYAHKDNIDEYFKLKTRVNSSKKNPDKNKS